MDFSYPHNDTSLPERPSRTGNINKLVADPLVKDIRAGAFVRRIPVSSDETLQFVCVQARACGAENILEIGAAVGASGIAILKTCPQAHLTTIEKNADFAAEAQANFGRAGLSDRVRLLKGDAADILPQLGGQFDFIFLDGPKVQYVKWLPHLKRLLRAGGMLAADDVLLYGWVNGEVPAPQKRHMLVEHVREYLDAVLCDEELLSYVADVGDGIALSVKIKDTHES